jgi:hypothetical protein
MLFGCLLIAQTLICGPEPWKYLPVGDTSACAVGHGRVALPRYDGWAGHRNRLSIVISLDDRMATSAIPAVPACSRDILRPWLPQVPDDAIPNP